ncbi:MAG: M28 family peptidase, partial [Prochlorococcaceae cyanobacterium]
MPDPDLQQRLLADLQQFAVPRHARWDPLGPLEEHRFGSGSDGGTNLILRLPGRESRRRPLLVGAHYDGPLQSPGADDNASGLVALLELAPAGRRILRGGWCDWWPSIRRNGGWWAAAPWR